METRFGKSVCHVLTVSALVLFFGGCASSSIKPVNRQAGVFFNELCAQAHVIYTVPAGTMLIIEDASAEAYNSATASIPGNPGIVDNVPVVLSLRTNPSGSEPMGSADHVIASGHSLPVSGGRTMKAYAAPGTDVLFLIGGCTVKVNTTVYFSGQLVNYP
jgi:hypothetical protein